VSKYRIGKLTMEKSMNPQGKPMPLPSPDFETQALAKLVDMTREHLKEIGTELLSEISPELMDLTEFLDECQEHPGANITIGGMASIGYRLCDIFKFTGKLGYEALTATKSTPATYSAIDSVASLNKELATYQAHLGHMADQIVELNDSLLTFIPCDLTVLEGHPEITQATDLLEIIKQIDDQFSAVSERIYEIGILARQISQLESFNEEPELPIKADRDWRAMTAMLAQCISTAVNRDEIPEPRWIDEPIAHPQLGETGKVVTINHPTKPGSVVAWSDARKMAIFVPGGKAPNAINGVEIKAWIDHPKSTQDWNASELLMPMLDEPPMPKSSLPIASGVVTVEPDGRIWMVSPTNKFGGYETTFPKGKRDDKNLSLQANAIKEGFEESGLKVRITGYLGDFKRTTSITRLYLAERVSGKPTNMGWESQAVKLVPPSEWGNLLKNPSDLPVLAALQKLFDQPR
jgi:ADP-ribose pyrophosphatase YjhB (NUDIX family)